MNLAVISNVKTVRLKHVSKKDAFQIREIQAPLNLSATKYIEL